jgi:peptidoglycan/LPS O-acetylase OafA/YrhL
MRTSKIAAFAAILAGLVWIASGALSWDKVGLTDSSTTLWWTGLGLFALASALTGYSSVTNSPIWLKALVFLGAAAVGGSVVSMLDTEMDNAHLVIAVLGAVVLVLGLIGLLVGRGGALVDETLPEPPKHGRRAAR